MSTKILKAYTRLHGVEYVHDTIGKVVNKLIHRASEVEVDPNRMDAEADVDVNKFSLMQHSQELLSAVLRSAPQLPVQFRFVCEMLQRLVGEKFPEARHTCIGGFIFLRFLNPAILSPESFGLAHEKPEEDLRRV